MKEKRKCTEAALDRAGKCGFWSGSCVLQWASKLLCAS